MASTATLQLRCTMQPATNAAGRHAPSRARFAAPAKATSAIAAARARSTANMWREVQGSEDWDDLLQPLHPVVRDEVARYGKLVEACYDALDMDPSSPRHMCCKHGKETLLHGAGYEVTRYIYATPDVATTSGRSSCVGYVAVSTDEMTRRLGRRDVVVAFRGTLTRAEWAANLMSSLKLVDARPDVKVESGFLNLYTSAGSMGSCREQLLREVSRLITSFSKDQPGTDMSVTLAGHSMGSALATLLGYDLAELGLNRGASGRRVPVTVFSFGGPRVGNAAFKARCDELGVKSLRVANVRDPVTKLPGAFVNERTVGLLGAAWAGDCYTHVGVELTLDFLSLNDLGSVHDLGTYVAALQAETGDDRQVPGAANVIPLMGSFFALA
ncbi:hypothetical protein EJB05_18090, partial [Eragrostis curvula]